MKTTNFLQRCFGISLIVGSLLFGTGFLIRSVQSANATPPSPKEFIEEGASKIGKYAITMGQYSDGTPVAIILETETGKNSYYIYSSGGWDKIGSGLPLPE